jgi:hypothetical protein
MPNPLEQKLNDVAVKPLAPESPDKPKVPLAQEFALAFEIGASLFRLSRPHGWKQSPQCSIVGGKLQLIAEALLQTYPTESLLVNTLVTIPPLENTTAVVKRDDYLSLVGLIAEVGIAQDPSIGVSFRYREPNTTNILTTPTGVENSRRYRAFWFLTLSNDLITNDIFLNSTSLETNGDRRLPITNKTDKGFLLSPNIRIWALDPNLAAETTYTLMVNSIEVLPICVIRRIQNFQEDGIILGYGGEGTLTSDLISLATPPLLSAQDLESAVQRRLINEICCGVVGAKKRIKQVIINLSAGLTAGNPGKVGIAASSPNGSYCIGNDQRISFTNQRIVQNLGVDIVVASNDGAGKARLATGLNTNAPLGSVFSADKLDHKIYSIDGFEQSAFGSFSNLGGSGSLQWIAGENSTIRPGARVFFVPAIIYPAGSGLSVPFLTAESAYFSNGTPISPENIRTGIDKDLDRFELPKNGESFIIVVDSSRAAVQYIYRLVTVVANINGVATIPLTERGSFAFVQNVLGRIDAPVCKGLSPNNTYNALVYYPPRSTETWQLQFTYPEYQGIGNSQPTFLDHATIASTPLQILHSSGGGLSVHTVNTNLRSMAIAMHLPQLANPHVKPYDFDCPIQIPGETYPGPITFRSDISPLPAPGLAFPTVGQVIELQDRTGSFDRSINKALYMKGQLLGVRSPVLASRSPYQLAIAFTARKGADIKLVVVTHNCYGVSSENIAFDPNQDTAIDVFDF